MSLAASQATWETWVGSQSPREFAVLCREEGMKTHAEMVESYLNGEPASGWLRDEARAGSNVPELRRIVKAALVECLDDEDVSQEVSDAARLEAQR